MPDAAVAVGARALVLLHAQQGTGATLVAARSRGAAVGGPEQAAATTAPITEAAAALRADGSALAAYAVAQSPMTISSAARAAAGGWSPGGDVALPAGVTLVQQLHLSALPDGSAVLLFLGQGPAAGDVPRPYAAVRSAAGAWGALRSRSIPAPSWPAPISASRSTRSATPTRRGASPTAACARRCCPLGGAFAPRSHGGRVTARTPRRRRLAPPAAACCWRWIDAHFRRHRR